jgi:hypothetical protein
MCGTYQMASPQQGGYSCVETTISRTLVAAHVPLPAYEEQGDVTAFEADRSWRRWGMPICQPFSRKRAEVAGRKAIDGGALLFSPNSQYINKSR